MKRTMYFSLCVIVTSLGSFGLVDLLSQFVFSPEELSSEFFMPMIDGSVFHKKAFLSSLVAAAAVVFFNKDLWAIADNLTKLHSLILR